LTRPFGAEITRPRFERPTPESTRLEGSPAWRRTLGPASRQKRRSLTRDQRSTLRLNFIDVRSGFSIILLVLAGLVFLPHLDGFRTEELEVRQQAMPARLGDLFVDVVIIEIAIGFRVVGESGVNAAVEAGPVHGREAHRARFGRREDD